jgi:hypothetical protein
MSRGLFNEGKAVDGTHGSEAAKVGDFSAHLSKQMEW